MIKILEGDNPIASITLPPKDSKVAAFELIDYKKEEDMTILGAIAASLFAVEDVNLIVVRFEEELAKSKKLNYKVSEKYLDHSTPKTFRTPMHFAECFERGLLKNAGVLCAFTPNTQHHLSDGDSYFVVYAREHDTSIKVAELVEEAMSNPKMNEVPNGVSDIANDAFVKRTDFSMMDRSPKFIWESSFHSMELDLANLRLDVVMKEVF